MNILFVGKFPPVQGGVSTSCYWSARDLCEIGHNVFFLTNAENAEPNIKSYHFAEDKQFLNISNLYTSNIEAIRQYDYTPWASPFLTQLIGRGTQIIAETEINLIIGWYFEPYGMAAAMLSQMFKIPLVLRHAGSDMGRLCLYPELRSAYAWASKQASVVVASQSVVSTFEEMGVTAHQIVPAKPRRLPEIYSDQHDRANLSKYISAFPDWLKQQNSEYFRYFENVSYNGRDDVLTKILIYGKIGNRKGSYSLIEAMRTLVHSPCILLVCIAGLRRNQEVFFESLTRLPELKEKILLLPPVMPWHIPKILNACDIALFLENRFPISFHSPLVPREILASSCHLVCSKEIVDKSPFKKNMVDGKNISIVTDLSDPSELARRLDRCINNIEDTKDQSRHGRYLSDFIESCYAERSQLCDIVEAFT